MGIRVALHHVTHYTYDRPVQLGPHVIRLRPAPHSRTPIQAYSLKVTPSDHFLNWQQDPFSNWQARFVFPHLTREFKFEVDLVADLTTINPFDFFLEEYAEHVPFTYEPELRRELTPYLETFDCGSRFAQLVGRVRDDIARPERRTIDVLVDVNQLIQRSLKYDIRMEPGVFSPDETLTRGHGSCRDFAWLMVNVLRNIGFAARFVSGYSIQLVADQKPVEGPVGVLEDVTDLHAWTEVYLPGAGWIGLDSTSGLLCGEGHIPLACTADPGSAAPVTGSYSWQSDDDDDKVKETFKFEMSVTRIEDRPRPTKPFSDAQWEQLIACGDQVERSLVASDVRLTFGGEPTFVAMDDPEGDEWNTAAVGPTKRIYADKLIKRLMNRFAQGGLLHYGQGKWYPGEPLPRWAFSCYFRRDGEPIWKDPRLIADENVSYKHGDAEASALMKAVVERLQVGEQFIIPAHEDVFYYLWRERRLPVNVDPFDSKLEDKQERDRLRRVFMSGLSATAGYCLPLRAWWDRDQITWQSGRWFLRDERMYLLPGDSPMGYRLPLDSIAWTPPGDQDLFAQRDPFAPRTVLPTRKELAEPKPGKTGSARRTEQGMPPVPFVGQSAGDIVRTALCIEPREGRLHVFMPPLMLLEEYLDLIANIEEAAAALKLPVHIEGYHPPSDYRLDRMQVTPDPGVIEVNIHAARSWREVVANTTALYDEARECKLASDKFMVDGRHTGTGGGNHITLGGPTPADSPFLRRPDLL
ncbi:MAG TPA: transglutaminase family protein, partial [Polyangiales bacterium]